MTQDLNQTASDPDRPMDFEAVVDCIRRLPATWCPAILQEVVCRCDSQQVFREGMLLKTVERILALQPDKQ